MNYRELGNTGISVSEVSFGTWILDQDEISYVIPGFRNEHQITENLRALEEKPFSTEELQKITQFYEEKVKHLIRGPY